MTHSEKTPLKQQGGSGEKFSSTFGVVATCLGCAIGTGNVWRFPRMVALNSGKKGALCFLLPWTLFLFLWSVPMLIIEYGLGRYTGHGVVTSLQRLLGDKAVWCGLWIVLVNFMIGCWYQVIMGWCLFYAYQVTFYPLPQTIQESNQIFNDYIDDSYWPVLTQALSVIATGLLMIRGIRLIERSNMVIVPLLLLLVVIVFIWSLTRQGALQGIKFFFTPDWSTMARPRLWIDAASQNAFDCGAGWGQFIAFAAAMKASDPIMKYSLLIPIGNNIISLICGMMTFSTAFSSLHIQNTTADTHIVDILQTSGPAGTGLTFIWLPVLFASADVTGRVFAILFFMCLVLGALSSLIGTLQNVVQTLNNYGVPRVYSVLVIVLSSFIIGLGSAIDLDFLTNQDFTWAFALIISGLMLQATVIKYGVSRFREHVINNSVADDWRAPKVWEWIVKFVAPIEGVTLLVWWVVDTIIQSEQGKQQWFSFRPQTILPVLIQWLGWLGILIIINVILVRLQPQWFLNHSSSHNSYLLDDSADDLKGEIDSNSTEVDNGSLSFTPPQDKNSIALSETNGHKIVDDMGDNG